MSTIAAKEARGRSAASITWTRTATRIGGFEVKFYGPEGVLFDVAEHPWTGTEPLPLGEGRSSRLSLKAATSFCQTLICRTPDAHYGRGYQVGE